MYRSKFWKQEERMLEKARKRENWFGDKFDTVVFVENTKNSTLAKECQRVINKSGLKIKVVERTGTTMKDLITRMYPYERKRCERCAVCDVTDKVNCRTRYVVYRM